MSFSASLRELQTLSGQQWLDRASKTLPQALSVVLVVAIAWQLVQLTWLLLDRGAQSEESIPIAPPTTLPAKRGVDVQTIIAAHLFGTPKAATQNVENAPLTAVNLVLSAVFAANDPTKGLAIIGENPQSAKVYAVGKTVAGGARLHAVYPEYVLLDRDSQLEKLMLPKQSTAGMTISRAAQPRFGGNQQFVENLRQIAENNPSAFAEIVRPQPVFANGVQRGYRVYPGRNRQLFAKLGLQPGDLVTTINGTPLDDPQRGMEIFNTIASSDRVQVTVERNGQAQELTLNTAQIMLPDANSPSPPERSAVPRQQRPTLTPTPE